MKSMPYATGVANSAIWSRTGSACRRSRRYTTTADTIRVTPSVNATWTSSNSGTHADVGCGMNAYTTNRPPNATNATALSRPATATLAIGNTSRGNATLLRSGMFWIRLWPPCDTEVEKNVHGRSPRYEKSGYGTPPVSIRATRLKNSVNTTIRANGVIRAQARPNSACLYRARSSRSASVRTSSRDRHTARTAPSEPIRRRKRSSGGGARGAVTSVTSESPSRHRSSTGDLPVHLLHASGGLADVEGPTPVGRGLRHPGAEPRIPYQRHDGVREEIGARRRDQQPLDPVLDPLGDPAHGRGHDRRAQRQGLHARQRQPLVVRCQSEQVEGRHHPGRVLAEAREQEPVAQAKPGVDRPELVLLWPAADRHEPDRQTLVEHQPGRLEQHRVPLLGAEVCHGPDHELVGPDAELGPDLVPMPQLVADPFGEDPLHHHLHLVAESRRDRFGHGGRHREVGVVEAVGHPVEEPGGSHVSPPRQGLRVHDPRPHRS